MIIFLMPIAHPPNITKKREKKGRNQCFRRLRANSHDRWGLMAKL
jgi:hypothetical protein